MTPKLTKAGYKLLVAALDGTGIQFSKFKVGNGAAPDDYGVLADLINPLIEVGLDSIEQEDQYVLLQGTFKNTDLGAGFYWQELGIFAVDPGGGDDILYAYCHYTMEQNAVATYFPVYSSNMIEATLKIHVYVGDAEDVTAVLAASSTYATAEMLEAHTKSTSNPHNVTAEQVGLGNVPNVATNNQTPTFTIASVLSNLVSGEKLSIALGKIAKAIDSLISHIDDKVSHITSSERSDWNSKAAGSHNHAASDINSGTLPVARGGTGASNAAEALAALGAVSMDDIPNLYVWKKYEGDPSVIKETSVSNATISWSMSIAGTKTPFTDIPYADAAEIVDGSISLVDSVTLDLDGTPSTDQLAVLLGKYIRGSSSATSNYYYYIPADATFTTSSTAVKVSAAKRLSVQQMLRYVADKASDTYPESGEHTDGYWYEYHKQLGD